MNYLLYRVFYIDKLKSIKIAESMGVRTSIESIHAFEKNPLCCDIVFDATSASTHPETKYIEIVASIASKSAGRGTRANIDEFTQTTRDALKEFSKIQNTKAIIILNPADPPIIMRNTIYAIIENPNIEKIYTEVHEMAKRIKEYVPGYRVVVGPIYENGRVTTTVEVVGLGDYLPSYSGNLDIITCAAIKIAEEYAMKKIAYGGVD